MRRTFNSLLYWDPKQCLLHSSIYVQNLGLKKEHRKWNELEEKPSFSGQGALLLGVCIVQPVALERYATASRHAHCRIHCLLQTITCALWLQKSYMFRKRLNSTHTPCVSTMLLRSIWNGEDLKSLLPSSGPETCFFNPIPTYVLHEFVDELFPILVHLCILWLAKGFPSANQNCATVLSSLQKLRLKPENSCQSWTLHLYWRLLRRFWLSNWVCHVEKQVTLCYNTILGRG